MNTNTDEFANAAKVEPKSFDSFPMLFLNNTDADNIGASVVGTFLHYYSFPRKDGKLNDKGQPVLNHYVDFVYDRSDKTGGITKKVGSAYAPITPKSGDIVTLFCPARLARALNQLNPGDRFYAGYQGMRKPKGSAGGPAHHFEVKKAGTVALTDEQTAHIASRLKAKEEFAKKNAVPVGVDTSAADAEKAMGELVD